MIEYINIHRPTIIVHFLNDRKNTIHPWHLEKSDKKVERKKHNKVEVTAPNCKSYTKAS